MERKRPLLQISLDNHLTTAKRSKSIDEDCSVTPLRRTGTITQMVLKNFMCHSLLVVNFKKNINYVTGRNGSGKSAILTALVVGLGAKATVTNRGASIRDFIKTGKNSASVEITLNNRGPMAYKPSIYGNEIKIMRNFTASGNSSYKVKSASGVVISTHTREIHRITTCLNIQIDNPVCVLNQDTSRTFLSTSDPKQKFILFMRATKLETLYEEYKNIVNNRKASVKLFKEKDKVHEELKAQLTILEEKIENHRSIVKLQDKVTSLQKELLWAKVRDSEHDLLEHEKIVEQVQQKYARILHNCENRIEKLEQIKQRVSELQQQIMELKEASEVQSVPQKDAQKCLDELRQKFTAKRREKQSILKSIEDKNRDSEALQAEIGNFTSNLSRIEQEKLERLREMKKLEEKSKQIENILETTENDVFQMRSNVKRKVDEEKDLQREIHDINDQCNRVQENLSTLQSETNNSLLLYGRDMPRVLKAIEANKHKFSQMPRGPLGAYIKIKDEKWAVAVEGFLGPGLLKSFAVDNKRDNVLLMDIFKNHWSQGMSPMVITSKFFYKVHNVSANLVPTVPGCVSVYDAIDVSDPVVMNCLIDQKGLEGVLLIPTTDKAIELMSEANRVPINCKQGITIKGDKYFPDPNYKTYASRYHQARYLQVNTSDLIRQYEDKLKVLNEKRKTVESQYNAIKSDKSEQNAKLTELIMKLDKLKQANNIAKRKLDDFKSVEEPEYTNINSLETELNEINKYLLQRKLDVEKVELELREIKSKIAETEERLNGLIQANRAFEERIIPLEQQIMEESNKKKELNVGDNFEKKRSQDLKKQLDSLRSELTEKQQTVNIQTQQANVVGERIEEIRNVIDIAEELNDTQKSIRMIKSDVDSPEETLKKYEKAQEIYHVTSTFMRALYDDIQELTAAVSKRSKWYKYTEDYFITFLNHNFSKILEFRQFKGGLEIDMEEKKLELIVIPQQGSQGHTASSNLSGGERSYATVSFLYALWQCMEFPFYFLDEFDVFMDNVNRTKVMEVLIHHAKSRPDLQFVFLTPQDVSFIHDDDVAVHRLEDPERVT